jgi:hypothetical protein
MLINTVFLGVIGPFQIILLLIFPVGIFLFGYYLGKKSGYIKRVKEQENK